MLSRACASLVLVGLITSTLIAQSRKEPRRIGVDEQAALQDIVEQAASGNRPLGGNAFLKWTPHFLRGPNGKTYVPFTLRIDEAPGSFGAAAMYIRIAPRGDTGRTGKRAEGVQNLYGVAPGEMPVNAPDRRQGAGAPTPAEASLMLRSLTAKSTNVPYPYEAAYGIESNAAGNSAIVRRALAVTPGDYDLYIAVVERDAKGDKKWAVMKRPISVPNLASHSLRLSSVIVADSIEPLAKPLTTAEQSTRPYALGAAELVPADDQDLRSDETLHLAFVIYDAAVDARGKPDVLVEYRLFLEGFTTDRLLGSTAPQVFDSSTLPPGFDLRAGHQLAAMQSLPLAGYKPGSYRMVIRVIDRRATVTAEEEVRFVITD